MRGQSEVRPAEVSQRSGRRGQAGIRQGKAGRGQSEVRPAEGRQESDRGRAGRGQTGRGQSEVRWTDVQTPDKRTENDLPAAEPPDEPLKNKRKV